MSRISRNIAQIIGRLGTFPVEGDDSNPVYGWRDMTADLNGALGQGATAPTWAEFRDGMYAAQFATVGKRPDFNEED